MSLLSFFKLKKSQSLINPELIAKELINFEKNNNLDPKKITDAQREQVLSIYTAYYPSVHEIPSQRLNTHNTFLTIFTFVFSALGYAIYSNHEHWSQVTLLRKIIFILMADFIFLSITVTWARMLKVYVNFNYVLILITKSLEKYLPVQPLENLFSVTERLKIPTNLAEDMARLPVLLSILAIVASVVVLLV